MRSGYRVDQNNTLSNIVFFPLYPFLIKILSPFFLGNYIATGWAISSFFLLLACIYLLKLVRDFHPEADPQLAVLLLLVFPTAFFLNTVYTEALFLFLSVASFYYAEKREYSKAGIFGLLVALTRVTGILIFPSMLILLIIKEGFLPDKKNIIKALPLLLIPLGTMAFFLFHWLNFGDLLLFFKVESAWGRSFNFNPASFEFFSRASISNFALDFSYLIFILGILVALLKKKLYSYAFYVGSTVFVAVGTGTLMSIGRYILVLFPIYIVGATLKNSNAKHAWVAVSMLLMALNTILFVNWYWAG